MNVVHHFLKVPCPAGKMFNIQAMGDTANKNHKMGILIKAKINAVRRLNASVNSKITENIRPIILPKTAASAAYPAEPVRLPWEGRSFDGLSSCPRRSEASPIAVRKVLLNTCEMSITIVPKTKLKFIKIAVKIKFPNKARALYFAAPGTMSKIVANAIMIRAIIKNILAKFLIIPQVASIMAIPPSGYTRI